MSDKCTWPMRCLHVTKLHKGRKTGNIGKLMSPQVLTSHLRSPFAMYTENQCLLDCDILANHEGFHPEMESTILIQELM